MKPSLLGYFPKKRTPVPTPERIELLRSWKHSGFHVNADRRVAAGERRSSSLSSSSFALHGEPPPGGAAAWRTLRVHGWERSEVTALEVE